MSSLDSQSYQPTRQFLEGILTQAGQAIRELFGQTGVAYTKQDAADVVTQADLRSQEIIVKAIRTAFPDHGIISEEGVAERPDAEWQWIIDPLDGTRNFATGVPLFVIMAALAQGGELQQAAIYQPITNELFTAEKGKGAWLNGQRIYCSTVAEWTQSYGCLGAEASGRKLDFLKRFAARAEQGGCWTCGLSCIGYAGCLVASGRRDWYADFDRPAWDFAAPALLLREAGCLVTNAAGRDWQIGDRELIAATPNLHQQLRRLATNGFQ